MSALGGIYHFDGAAVSERLLAELGEALAARGPDGGREVNRGSLGMAYRAFRATPESYWEQQPLLSPDGLLLAWDGRLDNREELLMLLRDQPWGQQTDADIVIAAYRQWGADFLPRLIGDFALALWNPRTREVLLARDQIGTRTLYYYVSQGRAMWSTELAPLLELSGVSREVNDEYVAGFLTRDPDPGLTPYKHIFAVKPAHAITVGQDGKLRERRFWGLDPRSEIRYRKDEDYEEHFLQEFTTAVRVRLRASGPVMAELSGGLDSSSIVCMADRLAAEGEALEVETVSRVYDNSAHADERRFIRLVEEQRGKTGHHLREDDTPILSLDFGGGPLLTPNPLHCFAGYHQELSRLMRAKGVRVLLSGQGGDQIMGGSDDPAPELADLIVRFRLLRLHHQLRVWSAVLKQPYVKLLWQRGIVTTLPRGLQRFWRQSQVYTPPAWYDPQFVARWNLHDRLLGEADVFGFALPSERDQSLGFLSVVRNIATGYRREMTDFEVRYPYLHRPLVEFMQAIPLDQRVRPGESRSLMRRAIGDLLPAKIAARRGKGNPSEAVYRALAREWPRLHALFTDARVAAYGFMDNEKLLAALNQARYGCEPRSLMLFKTVALELWLRSLESEEPLALKTTAAAGRRAPQAAAV